MNPAAPLLAAAMFVAAVAAAQEPSPISAEAIDTLYHRIESQQQSQTVTSPNHRLRAVYRQTHPGVYGRNAGRVTILDQRGRPLASRVLSEHRGRLVAVARWSPDSKFCVFSTISAGGHSPWQFEPYVCSVATRRFRFLGGGSFAAVIDPKFRFAAPATVLFTTQRGVMSLPLATLDLTLPPTHEAHR